MSLISICIIMKDEESHLDDFLSILREKFADNEYEIVLVDTGSKDKSIEIAQKHGKECNLRLEHFEWCDDFAAARNYSIECASGAWILVLDCDEDITELSYEGLMLMIRQYPAGVGVITRDNPYGENEIKGCYTDEVERFFCRKDFYYVGRIHEQVRRRDGKEYMRVRIPLRVYHNGYLANKDALNKKAERNLELLLLMLENTPEDPYLYFQIGQCYQIMHDTEKACEYFGKGLEFDVDPKTKYVQLMVNGYGNTLLELGREEEAMFFENIYEEFAQNADFVCLMGNIYLRNGLVDSAISEFEKALTFQTADNEGANSYIPAYNLGCIYEVMGDIEQAKKYFEICGNFDKAKERLNNLPLS